MQGGTLCTHSPWAETCGNSRMGIYCCSFGAAGVIIPAPGPGQAGPGQAGPG